VNKIKVGLVDDHAILRQSISKALNGEFDIKVVASWNSGEDALKNFPRNSCDVCIVDLKLPGMNGISLSRKLKEIEPEVKIIILSAYTDEEDIVNSIGAGVLGYLPKDITVEELVEAVRSVFRGDAVLDPSITRIILDKFYEIYGQTRDRHGLSPMELEILSLASSGNSNKMIAARLSLKDGTVKFHFREIFKKLNAKDRTHAVALALKQGWIV